MKIKIILVICMLVMIIGLTAGCYEPSPDNVIYGKITSMPVLPDFPRNGIVGIRNNNTTDFYTFYNIGTRDAYTIMKDAYANDYAIALSISYHSSGKITVQSASIIEY